MAGHRRSPGIDDDWSEIDDCASIQSAASLDDDDEFCLLPEFNKPPKSPVAASTSTIDAKNDKPVPKPADDFERQPLYASTHKEKQPEEKQLAEKQLAQKHNVEKQRQPEPEVEQVTRDIEKFELEAEVPKQPTAPIPIEAKKQAEHSVAEYHDTGLEESQVSDHSEASDFADHDDPNYYYQCLVDLHNEAGKTIETSENINLSNSPTVLLTRATCRDLQSQLGELKLIHAAYAGSWTTDGIKIPLNPDLLSWIKQVNTELETIHDLLSRFDQDQFVYHTPAYHITDPKSYQMEYLAKCCENLEGYRSTFEGFYPIIKADFDEFKTESMSFPRYQAPRTHVPTYQAPPYQPPVVESRREPPRDPPNPSISRIRRELYALKDELQCTLVFLTRLQHEVPTGTLVDAPAAIRSLRDLIVVISTILTNNGTDWLDRDLGALQHRIIPYSLFVNLEPDVLHDVTEHLKEFYTQLDVNSEPLFQKYSAEMIQNHQITSLIEGGQMYNLQSIISLLDSMLMIEN